VLEEQSFHCYRCGLGEWFGEKIALELDHKDGDRFNNSRENLEALCPNCHSLTPTWRGKNIKVIGNGKKKVSEESLLEALKTHETVAGALRSVGLVPRGGNYGTARAIQKKYNLGV
jgi:hypothetical protein